MNPLSNYGTDIGKVLSKIATRNFRFGFEVQFGQIQNTTIKRINSEIDRISARDNTPQRLAALERDYTKLEKNKTLIGDFHSDMYSNQLRLTEMQQDVAAALAAFSDVDDDTNLTADEVTALTEKRDALIKDTSALLLSIHPDISTPFVVRDVKNMLETLKAMAPVEGIVDAADSGSPSNGNRQMLDDLGHLSSLLDTAYNVTVTTAENTSSISLNIAASLATKLADMTLLTEVELKKREDEIEDIKAHYGNVLRVISLSFEARISYLEQMSDSLEFGKIEPGSVMNLFV